MFTDDRTLVSVSFVTRTALTLVPLFRRYKCTLGVSVARVDLGTRNCERISIQYRSWGYETDWGRRLTRRLRSRGVIRSRGRYFVVGVCHTVHPSVNVRRRTPTGTGFARFRHGTFPARVSVTVPPASGGYKRRGFIHDSFETRFRWMCLT